MMIASDTWAVLSSAAPSARIVLRLADGTEIDIDRMDHFAQLIVITPSDAVRLDFASDYDYDIEEIIKVLRENDIDNAGDLEHKLKIVSKVRACLD